MSLFALPSRPTVPFNGVSGAQIERLETTQGLQFSEESFQNQRIEFRWTAGSANMWYVPSRSYIRLRVQLELVNGANISGDQFTTIGQIDQSPSQLNKMYLALLDDEKFNSYASIVLSVTAVRTAYVAYLTEENKASGTIARAALILRRQALVRAVKVAMAQTDLSPAPSGDLAAQYEGFAGWKDFLKYNCLPAIAPAHCACAQMFSSLTLTYGGQVVSTITSHVAQVDAFDKRTSFTSNAFARDGLANVNNFYAPDFVDRCAAVTSDYIEFLWQPPLSFFRFPHAIPSGDFRLNMTVDSKWKNNCIQAVGCKDDGEFLTRDDYKFSKMQMTMFNHFVQGPSTERAAFVLDLDNIVCQAQQSIGEGTLNRQFDISPDTTAIALAHTDMSPGPVHSNRSLFRFPRRKTFSAATGGTVVTRPQDDVLPYSLTDYQILFDGKQWPQQQGDPMTHWQAPAQKTTKLVQQYHETHSQTGLGYNSCGPETYQQFVDAGMFLYTTWPRANSNATRVALNESLYGLGAGLDNWQQNIPTDILIFTRFKRSYLVRIENGRVMRVETAQNTTDGTLTG